MKKIKIAHIFLSLNIGGLEKIGINLIKKLGTEKYDHHIICLDEEGTLGRDMKSLGFKISVFHRQDKTKIRLIQDLFKYFKNNGIQIIHTNNVAPQLWGNISAILAGVKIRIHTRHGRNFIHIRRKRFVNRFASFFSNIIIVVSDKLKNMIIKMEKISSSKIKIIYNGIDTDIFSPKIPEPGIFKRLGLEKDTFIIGMVANFKSDKDHDTLLHSFRKFNKIISNSKLLLIGYGDGKVKFEKKIFELKLKAQVIILGPVDNIQEYLNIMDIFVLSTHTEGFSIALLEAMSTKKCVLATSVGGNVNIINHGINGYLVKENDVDGLFEKLIELYNNKEERFRIGDEARKTVKQNYSLNKMTDEYEKIYTYFYNNMYI